MRSVNNKNPLFSLSPARLVVYMAHGVIEIYKPTLPCPFHVAADKINKS